MSLSDPASSRSSPGSPASQRNLPLSAQERGSLMRAGALALDAAGREVLMGLSAAQSQVYLAFLRQPTASTADRDQHQALTLQLERARLRRSAEAPDRHSVAAVRAAMFA